MCKILIVIGKDIQGGKMKEKEVSPFIMVDKRLFKEVKWVSPRTGELFPFPAMDKFIYLYMKDRKDFFAREGMLYYENQDTIAEACGVSRKKVNSLIGKWMEEGVVLAHKIKLASGVSLVYDAVLPLPVVGRDGKIFIIGE